MYAVIQTGGKQYRVAEGQRIDVELLGAGNGSEVTFTPVLVVDGGQVLGRSGDLTGARVTATVVGEAKGPKIRGGTYKNKTNSLRQWGHRQHYSTIEITKIVGQGSGAEAAAAAPVAASAAAGGASTEEA